MTILASFTIRFWVSRYVSAPMTLKSPVTVRSWPTVTFWPNCDPEIDRTLLPALYTNAASPTSSPDVPAKTTWVAVSEESLRPGTNRSEPSNLRFALSPRTLLALWKTSAPSVVVMFSTRAVARVACPSTSSVPLMAVLPVAAATVSLSVLTEKAPTTFAACFTLSEAPPDASRCAARSTICTLAYSPVISSL